MNWFWMFRRKTLKEKVEADVKNKGLKLKYSVGERLPWRGIWFTVTHVEKDSITIAPDSVTNKYSKILEIQRFHRERHEAINGLASKRR